MKKLSLFLMAAAAVVYAILATVILSAWVGVMVAVLFFGVSDGATFFFDHYGWPGLTGWIVFVALLALSAVDSLFLYDKRMRKKQTLNGAR